MIAVSKSLEDTEALAAKLIHYLPAESDGATILGLVGDLGSGKTTFVQALARQLGVTDPVTSPTFVIEKIYPLPPSSDFKWRYLIHIDAYRLTQPQELINLNWSETISNPQNLILIEWADRVASILPPQAKRLEFRFIDETRREMGW